ncbi:hypothetical protein BDBG_06028 [Blastomyces gilchristii SLH14081]|uniref:Uncharacterized protein n=1 Tax=Blastomyces gilchristii (strain SLH14081) TaxID=559298 RepID=A0A179USQ5_BLAGS|nr:uncharacterized protein BDBG_06028 [Blastomyces gilchristii SLH14081]OAT11064.1 hypothetical protein BDBG_06028 [Blastomyces gilchristii SLH14081]
MEPRIRQAVTARPQRYSPAFFRTVVGWAAEVRAPMGEAIDWGEERNRGKAASEKTGGKPERPRDNGGCRAVGVSSWALAGGKCGRRGGRAMVVMVMVVVVIWCGDDDDDDDGGGGGGSGGSGGSGGGGWSEWRRSQQSNGGRGSITAGGAGVTK